MGVLDLLRTSPCSCFPKNFSMFMFYYELLYQIFQHLFVADGLVFSFKCQRDVIPPRPKWSFRFSRFCRLIKNQTEPNGKDSTRTDKNPKIVITE